MTPTGLARLRRFGGIGTLGAAAMWALCVLLGHAAAVRADDDALSRPVNLWPIFDDRVDPIEKARVRSGVGPLIHWSRSLDGDVHEFGLRPLFFWRGEDAAQRSEWEFLYPLMTYRRNEGDWDFQFFQILNARGEGSPQAGRADRRDFFPFYFSGVRENGDSYFGILPFWGRIYDHLFWDEMAWVGFPFYLRTVRGDTQTQYYPWPLISRVRGTMPDDTHRGFRILPLYGHEIKEGAFEKTYVAWPFYIHQRTDLDGDNPEELRAFLPFYTARRSPNLDQTNVLILLYTHTVDREKQYEQWDAPWPFFKYARGESRQALFLFPLYMRDHKVLHDEYLFSEIQYDDFAVLFPLFIRQTEQYIGSRKTRHRILWYFYSDIREEGRDGDARRIDAWPFMRYDRDREGRVAFQTLALVEAILPGNEWIERNYSPLWSLYTYRANPDGEWVRSFLWNLVRHEETRQGKSIEVLGPLFAYQEKGQDSRVSLLGGLVRYEVHDATRSLRLGVSDVVTWTATPQQVATLEAAGGIR